MPVEIIMPKLDKLMEKATLVQWYKQEGQPVKEGEPIALIETEKVTADLESPASGTLVQRCAVGSTAAVGEIIGQVYRAGEQPEAAATPRVAEPIEVQKPEAKAAAPSETIGRSEVKATPVARRIAREQGVQLETIKGSGPGGIITREDVIAQKSVEAPSAEETIPLTGWRKTMAERMSKSKHTAAHITTVAEVDVTELVKLREEVAPTMKEKANIRLTYTPFVVKAIATALQEYPIVNSSLADDKIILKKDSNIGLAVAREDKGLIVPVIHNADKMDLIAISKRIEEITEKAKKDAITFDDVREGTFTITNVGMFGVIFNTPIINLPQSAVIGIGAIKKRPVVVDDQITIRSMMYLALSYDHRVIDGLPAISFLQRVRKLLEDPKSLLPSM